MLRLRTITLLGLAGILAVACSSDDEDNDSGAATGGPTGGNGRTGDGTGTDGTGTDGTGTDGTGTDGAGTRRSGQGTLPATVQVSDSTGAVVEVPVIPNNDGTGLGTATAPDGTILSVAPDGTVGVRGSADDPVNTLTGTDGTDGTDGTGSTVASDWDVNYPTDACTQVSAGAEGTPVILQLVIDKSTSMNESAPSTQPGSKWDATVEALVQSYPLMDRSLAVGALYYPNTRTNLTPPGCEEPDGGLITPIAPLDDAQVQALIAGAQAVPNPTTPPGTPTHDAWLVGLDLLREALANPPAGFEGARGYLALMTDGMPTHTVDCGPAYGMNSNQGCGRTPRCLFARSTYGRQGTRRYDRDCGPSGLPARRGTYGLPC